MRNFAIAVAMLAVAAAVPLVVGAQEGGDGCLRRQLLVV